MEIRPITSVERNIVDSGLAPVTLPATTSVIVMPDTVFEYGEIAYIEVFNAGSDMAYYCYGPICNTTSKFNGFLTPGQALTIQTRQAVSMYSPGGTTIARTVLKRDPTISPYQ